MSKRNAAIWWDDALRERDDAIARIERDAISFVAQAVAEFETNEQPSPL